MDSQNLPLRSRFLLSISYLKSIMLTANNLKKINMPALLRLLNKRLLLSIVVIPLKDMTFALSTITIRYSLNVMLDNCNFADPLICKAIIIAPMPRLQFVITDGLIRVILLIYRRVIYM